MDSVLPWIFVAVSVVGSYYNSTLRLKLSYTLWFLSNMYFVAHNFLIGEYAQAFLFVMNFVLSCIGLKNYFRSQGWFDKIKFGE